MPKYHICILAVSRDTYPNGLGQAVSVDKDDLHTDSGRHELAKTLWQRMLRVASEPRDSKGNTNIKIGEGAGTQKQEACIFADPPTIDLSNTTFDDRQWLENHAWFNLGESGQGRCYRDGYFNRRIRSDTVVIIYELETTAKTIREFAQQICSAQVVDHQLKKALMFIPLDKRVLNRFEAVDLIEPKPKEPEQKKEVKPVAPQDAAKPTASTKPDEKAAEAPKAAKPAAKPTKPKSSKKKKPHASSSKQKEKLPASPYDAKYYQGAMNELLESIQSACDEYKDKKKKKHKKEFQELVGKLDDIQRSVFPAIAPKHQYEQMIREVEGALLDAQRDFSKPFLKTSKRKTWDEYATKATHSSSYQYPKLLSKVLHDVYSKDDPVAQAKLNSTNPVFVQMRNAIDKINNYLAKKSTPKLKK